MPEMLPDRPPRSRVRLAIGGLGLLGLTLGGMALPTALVADGAAAGAAHAGGRLAATSVPAASVPAGAVVVTARSSPEGRILETSTGYTLYTFSGDAAGFHLPTACTAANTTTGTAGSGLGCSTVWPPLTVGATTPIVAMGGVRQGLLGRAERPSGSYQVTYDGHPLYGFVKDTAPGEMNGENLASFFGIWHVVSVHGYPAAGRLVLGTEVSAAGVVLSAPTASFPSGPTHRSLYQLTLDPDGKTTCTTANGCASIWPPLLAQGRPMAGPGVNPRLIGTLRRPDGAVQVTYAGRPLYMFAFDLGPGGAPSGLTNGEYLIDNEAHGVWYLMSPTGLPDPGTATLRAITVTMGSSTAQVVGLDSGFSGAPFPAYAFTLDTPSASACTGTCARDWPPVLTSTPPAAMGLSGPVGVVERPDGSYQVTYDGHPLYFFAFNQPGGAQGQGVAAFGGKFWLVDPTGMLDTGS